MKTTKEKYVLMHTTKNTYRSLEKHSFIDFLSYEKCANYIVEHEDLISRNRDKRGRFTKLFFTDVNGNHIADYGDKVFDIDGFYNMYRILKIDDLDINDWLDIFETSAPFVLIDQITCEILEQIELELRDTQFYKNYLEFIEFRNEQRY